LYPGTVRDYSHVKHNLRWDLNLATEFQGKRPLGYSFVIDVLEGIPRLALYHMKINCSISTTVTTQPSRQLLLKALYNQGWHCGQDGLYQINEELRCWIQENLLQNHRR